MAEERFLGNAGEEAQRQSYLPFTRRLMASGAVDGSLEESAKAAGVPAVAALEMARAFRGVIDFDEDLMAGDSFAVAWRQEYTVEGNPIGVPQVMWAELHTSVRGTLSMHRFRASRSGVEKLWFADGVGTGPTLLRWPVDDINISSGFGLRPNPIPPPPVRVTAKATNPKGRKGAKARGAGGPATPTPAPLRAHSLLMHYGVDFAAEMGTPIHAAAAGTVTGARPNGGYGNWIEIQHEGEYQTIYGHMSAFATGIKEGVWVERGQLIGFVGSTGRSTGPHVHFELLHNGVPTNPIVNPLVRRPQLRGGDLARFRRLVLHDLEDARQEEMAD